MPIEPPPTYWQLPDPHGADDYGLAGVGADLEPGTLLSAYRSGLFPMPVDDDLIGWWSPDPRGVIPLDGLYVSRSLAKHRKRFEIRMNTCFTEVMSHCGDPRRPHGWITTEFIDAYATLHDLGWANSIEVYQHDVLVGGLYGLRIGALFAGESMFHSVTNASKVAMAATVDWLHATGATLFDVQWTTPHLTSMGAIDLPREQYLRQLAGAVG